MSIVLISLGASLLAAAAPAVAGDSPLLGSWRVTAQTTTLTDATGRKTEYSREVHLGYIMITKNRIMVTIAEPGRAPPMNDADKVELFNSFIAYTGKIALDPEKYVVTLDYSLNMMGISDKQVRYYTVDGDSLTIRTAEGPSMVQPGMRAVTILKAVREH